MNYVEILAVAAAIMGIIMSAAGIPQILKIIKRKSSKDVSIMMMMLFLIGVTIWLVYGVYINNYPIIIGNAVGVVVWGATLITTIKYRK